MSKKCSCYCQETKTQSRCNGTRERDICSCGGDESKCDFYPEKREKAAKVDHITDNEIIKAKALIEKLKEANDFYYDVSKSMPYDIDTTVRESRFLIENLLQEINRQKAEIESLERRLHNAQLHQEETYKALQKEQQLRRLAFSEDFIKAEAIKEFAERLNNELHEYRKQYKEVENFDGAAAMLIAKRGVEIILKEMVGDV